MYFYDELNDLSVCIVNKYAWSNVYDFHVDLCNDLSDHAHIGLKLYTSETINAEPCVSNLDKILVNSDKVTWNNV